MSDSTLWWLLAAGAVTLELLTGTFFLLMTAVGMAAGAMAAHAGLELAGQLVVAALVGGGGVLAWQRWRKARPDAPVATQNRDVNLDIGEVVQVEHWLPDGSAVVRYRGAEWAAAMAKPLTDGKLPIPGAFRIVAVEGSRLLVVPV